MIKTVKKYILPHKDNDYKPHLLREGALAFMFCLGLVLFFTSLGSSYLINQTKFGAAILPGVLVDLTNNHRVENNLPALSLNPLLEKSATLKAEDMSKNNYFAHVSPSGITPWEWFSRAGYKFAYAGENLAVDFTESRDVERAWINSPTHNANLISSRFNEIGIATYKGTYNGKNTIFVVQHFGKQADSQKQLASANLPSNQNVAKENVFDSKVSEPKVKGETSSKETVQKENVLPIVDEPEFVAVINLEEASPEEEIVTQRNSVGHYSTFFERLLVKQSRLIQYAYLIFIVLVYIVLISMVVVEIRVQHPKNIILTVLLLCFLSALSYLNSSFILSFV